jgi:hypothetical protein
MLTPEQLADLNRKRCDNIYDDNSVLQAAYAAGRAAGLEEAATICDAQAAEWAAGSYRTGVTQELDSCAAAIRERMKP